MQTRNFDNLAVMVDCSRNAVKTVEEMKRFITLLAKMGYNEIDLYMEDTYTIEGEDFFGYMRGKYSPEELKEIDDFAFSLGVEVVPFIQVLGHLNQMFQWGAYKDILDIDRIMLVGADRSYELIEKMIVSLKKCFRSRKIHLGMDETYELGKGKYRDINGEVPVSEIFISHVEKVYKIVKKHDMIPLMWGDMFFSIFTGKHNFMELDTVDFNEEFRKKVPEDLTVFFGNYSPTEVEYYEQMIKNYKNLTNNLACIGGAWKWTGWNGQNYTAVPATIAALQACINEGVRYFSLSLWGDNGAECSDYSVLPAFVVAACYNQGIFEMDEIKAKCKEWTGVDFDLFYLISKPDFDESLPLRYIISPSKYQLYNDCFMGLYDKGGVYEGDGEMYKSVAEKIYAELNNTGEYRYVFETIAKLCDVLEIKAEIGIRTHKAYFDKNIDELKKIICEYDEMIKRTEALYEAFKTQWLIENKPQGFDVQDIRFGGLIMRMKHCKERLQNFVDGKVESLPELEEKQIEIIHKKELVNDWCRNVTANVFARTI